MEKDSWKAELLTFPLFKYIDIKTRAWKEFRNRLKNRNSFSRYDFSEEVKFETIFKNIEIN